MSDSDDEEMEKLNQELADTFDFDRKKAPEGLAETALGINSSRGAAPDKPEPGKPNGALPSGMPSVLPQLDGPRDIPEIPPPANGLARRLMGHLISAYAMAMTMAGVEYRFHERLQACQIKLVPSDRWRDLSPRIERQLAAYFEKWFIVQKDDNEPNKTAPLWDSATSRSDKLMAAFESRPYNPQLQWLAKIEQLDPGDYAPGRLFFEAFEFPDPITRPLIPDVEAAVLETILERLKHPGAISPFIPILTGPQNAGKSLFCKLLTPPDPDDIRLGAPEARQLFVDTLKLSYLKTAPKEAYTALQGKSVVEIQELDGAVGNPQLQESIKSFVVSGSFTYRPPYGRKDISHPLEGAIIATSNSRNPIPADTSGNRRWLAIAVAPKPGPDLKSKVETWPELYNRACAFYRQQLIAQGRTGIGWRSPVAPKMLACMNEQAQTAVDVNESALNCVGYAALNHAAQDPRDPTWMRLSWAVIDEIRDNAGRSWQNLSSNSIQAALRFLSFERERVRENGRRLYVWVAKNPDLSAFKDTRPPPNPAAKWSSGRSRDPADDWGY